MCVWRFNKDVGFLRFLSLSLAAAVAEAEAEADGVVAGLNLFWPRPKINVKRKARKAARVVPMSVINIG